jgi:Mrp family chromosome partitioning ATPase
MSALDQAIIKAYAKDKSAAPPAGSAAAPHRAEAAPAMPADAGASIERTYHEGLLYRASVPVRAASTASTASATGVPRPHLLSPPPTSPRRGARRSLLRKLAAAPATPPVAAPSEPPPRVARKVIIRHVSHAAPPAPLGLSRLAGTAKTPGAVAEPASPVIELPPETIAQPPVPAETPVPAPAAPPFAPLNAAWPLPPQIEVHCDWHDADAMSAAAVLVESRPAPADRPWQMVAVELEALAAIELIAVEAETQARAVAAAKLPPPPPELRAESAIAAETPDAPFAARSFAAKSLSDREEPRPQFRWDAPHAGGWQRPHVRFFPATSSPVTPSGTSSGEDAPPPDSMEAAVAAEIEAPHSEPAHHGDSQPLEPSPESSSPESSPERAAPEYVLEATLEEPCEPPAAAEPRAVEPLTVEELTLAEPLFEPEIVAEPSLDQPLASDLIPHEQDDAWLPGDLTFNASPAEATYAAAESAQAGRPAIPQWEVDSFQWPRTCQKLMADERGYLARAGDKLLAAAQDGLRVLAISGSRRGEGRTTLALCLARAAAKAGLQTAIMDCDFARPQLASKIGLEAAHGWQEAALGNIPLSEAAVKSLADNITVLPLESAAAARKVSLADPRVTATIRAAAATFDLLILDLGPLAAGAAPAFPPGEKCPLDAAIVVRDLRFATATESEAVGHALQDAGVEAVGIAENFVIEDEIPATSV